MSNANKMASGKALIEQVEDLNLILGSHVGNRREPTSTLCSTLRHHMHTYYTHMCNKIERANYDATFILSRQNTQDSHSETLSSPVPKKVRREEKWGVYDDALVYVCMEVKEKASDPLGLE